ncbi:hypothetical protein SPRG_15313 [Saprolegnia parasitica CBS 223.65]|uniref:BED-type domain-containing protein n=1 Tax=Saprolegnia parasitica (strain CBS 223.65) TaxID=695850 RepID=A0A067BNZ6_SAPPC|nr:hypothetical protein SPRG_15313 [Saprolegnia parasitica CBS 223.65]KDO18485.1 hypothetical protein SPRG_15313 [Saprolegnia parasitica CBS 223.65]|eukprot:XP_012210804.1 hypothetical protein SPRG_15313 [Saprolegnia parasitica CBS 223.65]
MDDLTLPSSPPLVAPPASLGRPMEEILGDVVPEKRRRVSSKASLSEDSQIVLFVDNIKRQVLSRFSLPDCTLHHTGRDVSITCWQCGKMIKIATGHLHLRSLKSHLDRCKGNGGVRQAPLAELDPTKKRRVSSKAAISEANKVALFIDRVRRQIIKKFNVPNCKLTHMNRDVSVICWNCGKPIKIASTRLNLANLKTHMTRCHEKMPSTNGKVHEAARVPSNAPKIYLCAGLVSDEIRTYCANATRMFGGCNRREDILKSLFGLRSLKNLSPQQLLEFQQYEFSTRKWNIIGTTIFSVDCVKVQSLGQTCTECLGLYRNAAFTSTLSKYRIKAQKIAQGQINQDNIKFIPKIYLQNPGAALARSFESRAKRETGVIVSI